MWYGLLRNGELLVVTRSNYEPTVLDFKTYINSDNDYEVIKVEIFRSDGGQKRLS